MSILSWVCLIIVLAWLTLTALAHFPKASRIIRDCDQFRLIPSWNFFAPTPCVHDYYIAYRDRCSDGSTSHWESLALNNRRDKLSSLWHPNKRKNKIIFDSVSSLGSVVRSMGNANGGECLSIPYLVILNAVVWCPPITENSIDRQFAIVQTPGTTLEQMDLVYVSKFHKI